MIDIDFLTKKYFYSNTPVEYELRNGQILKIYPILVKDWYKFEKCYQLLTIDKKEFAVPEIIQMSYLEFLFKVMCGSSDETHEINTVRLKTILSLCLNEKSENILFREMNNKPCIIIINDEDIIQKIISAKDFDEIKKIVLFQNIAEYDDTEMSADIRKVIEDVTSVKCKDMVEVTLEDKLIFLGNKLGLKNKDMLDMTYREFSRRFDMAVEEMDYIINRTAELSGNVKFKRPLEHLIYKKKRNKFEDYFVDADNFANKIQNA